MARKKYEIFDHTADMGLYIYGRDRKELFAAAAEALMAQLTNPDRIKPKMEREIILEAESAEELLRKWMAELLYLYQAESWLTSGVNFSDLTDTTLKATVLGENLDKSRHEQKLEIKAVTWHRLRIEKTGSKGNLRATVVLDI